MDTNKPILVDLFNNESLSRLLAFLSSFEREKAILDILIHYIDDTDKWWATVYYTKLDEE